jgi:hypothetical protein
MSLAQVISHAGKKIVFLDLSGCKAVDLPSALVEAKTLVSTQPKGSALILTNVSGFQLTKETSELMKEFSVHNTPYAKASAVVGVEGLKKIVYSAVQHVSGRSIPTFDTLDQAKDWLVKQ